MSDEIQEELPAEPEPFAEPLPARKFEVPEAYDPEDPYQYRLWELGGKPDPASGWLPSIVVELQPDGETYARVPLPEPSTPVSDVEISSKKMAERRTIREDTIFSDTEGLVGSCYAWLQRDCTAPDQTKHSMNPSSALRAGQGLCSAYGAQLRSWVDFAAQDFFQSMSRVDSARDWLEWVPSGEKKSIRELILDKIYKATYGQDRPAT